MHLPFKEITNWEWKQIGKSKKVKILTKVLFVDKKVMNDESEKQMRTKNTFWMRKMDSKNIRFRKTIISPCFDEIWMLSWSDEEMEFNKEWYEKSICDCHQNEQEAISIRTFTFNTTLLHWVFPVHILHIEMIPLKVIEEERKMSQTNKQFAKKKHPKRINFNSKIQIV